MSCEDDGVLINGEISRLTYRHLTRHRVHKAHCQCQTERLLNI